MEGIKTEIKIPKTQIKKSNSFFGSTYTLYEIHTNLPGICEMVSLKRYSELRELSEKLAIVCETLDIYLPQFPGKKLLKNRDSLTESRREKIERWLQIALKHPKLSKKILKFLDLNKETIKNEISNSAKPDETYVQNFINKLSSNINNKMSQIDKFSFNFFSRKRSISEEVLSELLKSLIPLASSDLYGGKIIDILTKLTSSDSYKDFSLVCKVLSHIDIYLLREMNLNDYLTKKKFVDSQLQAYNICKIYEENSRNPLINELLKNDQDAILVYRNWGKRSQVLSNRIYVPEIEWRPLITNDSASLKFRFIDRQLEILGEVFVESSVQQIVNMLTIPIERKKWDIRLVEMKPIASQGFIFTYSSEKTVYEFHTTSSISKKESSTFVEFLTTCYEKQEQNSKIGKISSSYVIERLDEHVFSTKESEDGIMSGLASDVTLGRIRVAWTSSYCETSFYLLRRDLFQEADVLQRSLERFMCVAEGREDQMENLKNDKNPLIDAFERKRLNRANTYFSSRQLGFE